MTNNEDFCNFSIYTVDVSYTVNLECCYKRRKTK